MKIALIILFSAFSVQIVYSLDAPVWHTGSVVLFDNSVIAGRIAVHAAYDVVLVDHGDSLSVFPAHKVVSARYYDSSARINRKFTVIQLMFGHSRISRLFEVVVDGQIQILRHLRSDSFDPNDHANAFVYFSYYRKSLTAINRFHEVVLPFIDSQALRAFIKKEKLSFHHAGDIMVIIQFLNRTLPTPNQEAI